MNRLAAMGIKGFGAVDLTGVVMGDTTNIGPPPTAQGDLQFWANARFYELYVNNPGIGQAKLTAIAQGNAFGGLPFKVTGTLQQSAAAASTAGIPQWALIGAAVLGGVWLLKRGRA